MLIAHIVELIPVFFAVVYIIGIITGVWITLLAKGEKE